eukprot:2896275-Pyramimonas_sp.AAC.1
MSDCSTAPPSRRLHVLRICLIRLLYWMACRRSGVMWGLMGTLLDDGNASCAQRRTCLWMCLNCSFISTCACTCGMSRIMDRKSCTLSGSCRPLVSNRGFGELTLCVLLDKIVRATGT